jgi:glyoxylate reductase
MKLGITRELPLDAKKLLEPYFETISIYEKGRPLSEGELLSAISDKDVFICQLTDIISEKVLNNAKRLKHLATFSTGVDHIDLQALKKRGIVLSHTPGVLTDATANLAWALILNCSRKVAPAQKYLAEGKFRGFLPSLFLGVPLERSNLGILGMGKIGQAVAHRALAFGMKVIYCSRTKKEIPGCTAVSFSELLRNSDILTIHCPLTSETRHIFQTETLKLMKPNAVLVNTARGPIINEGDLYQHLVRHPEFFAGLDVFEKEPEVFPGVLELPNALCVPHIGSASRWAREQMAQTCIQEAMRFARGEKLEYEYPI